MTNSEEPQLPVSPARRRQMLGKVIELHGIESTFVQNYAIVQCCYLLADLTIKHDSIYEKVSLLQTRMEWLEKHLATLSAKKPA